MGFPKIFKIMNHFEKPQHFNSCKLILATAFIAILAANVQAQKPKIKFQHLTIKDGLSQSPVDCIFQDNKGIIWFGTEEGLNKYDYDLDHYFAIGRILQTIKISVVIL